MPCLVNEILSAQSTEATARSTESAWPHLLRKTLKQKQQTTAASFRLSRLQSAPPTVRAMNQALMQHTCFIMHTEELVIPSEHFGTRRIPYEG